MTSGCGSGPADRFHSLMLCGGIVGIDVDHAVLDLGEASLNGVVDPLGGGMGAAEGHKRVGADLHVNVDAIAEEPGFELVDAQDPLLLKNQGAEGGGGFRVAGVVGQLADGVPADIHGGFEDEQADNHACDGVQDGEAQAGAQDAGEAAH